MEYVFFDIECACVYKETAKICAFGYVLSDENFNIIEKEDILINPKGKFHLTDRKGKEGLVLPYDYEDFKKYPPFPRAYGKIRALLQGKDRLVFGHATSNDVKYLNLETKRFSLPPLSYSFYDTQLLYMSMISSFDHQYGLEGITKDLDVDFTPHRAADDAYATMRICEAMCKKAGVATAKELIEKLCVLPGKTAGGRMVVGTSKAQREYREEKRRQKEEREKIRAEFCAFVDRRRPKKKKAVKNGPFSGKVFAFSHDIENNLSVSKDYIDGVYRLGGNYIFRAEGCNVYVGGDESDRRRRNAEAAGAQIVDEAVFAAWIERGDGSYETARGG